MRMSQNNIQVMFNPQTTGQGPMDPETSLTSAQAVHYAIYLRLWGPLEPSGGRSVSFFPRQYEG